MSYWRSYSTIYQYQCLHVPTGNTTTGEAAFASREKFLEALNRWNRNQPGVWVYYAFNV